MNVKILVCYHKQDVMATQDPYMPIHVGKALHPELDLGIQGDNTGDNISDKNGSYCELTGMYWAWKNLKNVDIIGLCHYRRYFDFHGQCQKYTPISMFNEKDFDTINLDVPFDVLSKVSKKGAVVVSKRISYNIPLILDYCASHVADDYRVLNYVIHKTQEEKYINAFHKVMEKHVSMSNFNMFLMKWGDFDAYCQWIFPILSEVEKYTDINGYTPFQKRIYGYMAERLFNVWLEAEKKETIKRPVIWFNYRLTHSLVRRIFHNLRSAYCSLLCKIHPRIKICPINLDENKAYFLRNNTNSN